MCNYSLVFTYWSALHENNLSFAALVLSILFTASMSVAESTYILTYIRSLKSF